MASSERQGPIRVAIVDDDPWASQQIANALEEIADIKIVGVFPSVAGFLNAQGADSEVVLLDVQLKNDPFVAQNVATIAKFGANVLLVSAFFDERSIHGALGAGASGFRPKSGDFNELIDALRAVARGDFVLSREAAYAILNNKSSSAPKLTPSEVTFLALYASGLPLKSVARRLNITYETAKTYSKAIRAKYRDQGRLIDSRVDLYNAALQDGFITKFADPPDTTAADAGNT